MKTMLALLLLAATVVTPLSAQEHQHSAPEKLGSVNFPVSCAPAVQADFNRGVALLHSFTYEQAQQQFEAVAMRDPNCAMAHWGAAMSRFHQLWEPPLDAKREAAGREEIAKAQVLQSASERERKLVAAAAALYSSDGTPLALRMNKYEGAMAGVASENPSHTESQVFYALALLATASPADKTHSNQKKAVAILAPLYAEYPEHPGVAHYLIHACDNSEMAPEGLSAAQHYSQIAPSAPHALHMPSHIFTRLGMWNESVQSNVAARRAAHDTGDFGEELHAMDYLTYAYLQLGRFEDAEALPRDLQTVHGSRGGQFKAAYAATAMPVRFAMERQDWTAASQSVPVEGAPAQVQVVAYWARAIGPHR